MASQDDFHVNLGMGGLLPACPHTFRDALDAPITFPQSFLADAAGYDLKGSCCISTMLHDKCLPPDGRALLRHDAAVLGETPNHFLGPATDSSLTQSSSTKPGIYEEKCTGARPAEPAAKKKKGSKGNPTQKASPTTGQANCKPASRSRTRMARPCSASSLSTCSRCSAVRATWERAR